MHLKVIKRHAHFVGPGILASVAYIDAGNFAAGLAAGSAQGYVQVSRLFD